MGGQVIATRGGMIHLVLQQCRNFEDAFNKAIDGGKGGASLYRPPAYLIICSLCYWVLMV